MSRFKSSVLLAGVCLLFSVVGFGQAVKSGGRSTDLASTTARPVEPDSPATSSIVAAGPQAVVPRLMKFSGVLHDVAGKPLNGSVDVTFSLYSTEVGGNPLWFETQSVQSDELGRYTALLGAMHTEGLPIDLFTSGEVRWLGIQVGSEAEQQPRVLLVSVPYALKAGDAETLGGKPASAYMLSDSQRGTASTTSIVLAPTGAMQPSTGGTNQKTRAANTSTLTACSSLTSDGTAAANAVPFFTSNCNLEGSNIVEYNGNLGFGIATPQARLHIFGPTISDADAHFNFILGDSTPAAAGTGGGIDFSGYYNGTTNRAGFASIRGVKENGTQGDYASTMIFDTRIFGGNQSERMRITSAGNLGIGTSTPAAKLEVNGTAQFDGAVTFAAGQNVTGNVSTAGQLISSVATGTAPLTVASTTQVANLNASQLGGFSASAFQPAGSYAITTGPNSFSGNQAVTGNVTATTFFGSGAGLMSVPATALAGGITVGGIGTGGITVALNATSPDIINGFSGNTVSGGVLGATIGGGGVTGFPNTIIINYGTIGGGVGNTTGSNSPTSGTAATVAGGQSNMAVGNYSFVGGGANNQANGSYATVVGGGTSNIANGDYSTIAGGKSNTANGKYSTAPGGLSNSAGGDYGFAAGIGAIASTAGTFVWADNDMSGTVHPFTSTAANQFLIRAKGGVGIGTASPNAGELEVNGGVRLNTATAQPTCDSTQRGTFWVFQGASNVKDSVSVCAKDGSDIYAWRTLY